MNGRRYLVPDYLDEDATDGSCDTTVLPSFFDLKRKTLEALYGLDRNMNYNHDLLMDKSPKGSVDEGIRSLLDLINAHPSFSTLSSCSGRISLFDPSYVMDSREVTDEEEPLEYKESMSGKGHGAWLISSHAQITFQQLQTALNDHSSKPKSSHTLMFKHEPLLLHVAASNISRGRQLLSVALNLGFRESGLVVTHKRITVAIRSHSLALNVPISSAGDLRPPDTYLKCLVTEANKRFDANKEKLARLENTVERELFTEKAASGENQTMYIESIQLPDLKLWNHSSVLSCSPNGNHEILILGGQGNGPHHCSKVARSEKIYSIDYQSNCFEGVTWKEINKSVRSLYEIAGFRVRPVAFGAREGHTSCSLNIHHDENVRVHAIFGGRTGPTYPIADLMLMIRSTHEDSVSFFTPQDIQGECPPRWGHTFTALSCKNANNLALVVGGRDGYNVLCDTYLLSFDYTIEKKKTFIWTKLDITIPRFDHYATILPSLSMDEDLILISGGLASTSLVSCASHETVQSTIVLKLNSDGASSLMTKYIGTQTFGGSLSALKVYDKVLVVRAGGLSSDPTMQSASSCDFDIFEVLEENGELVFEQLDLTLDIDLGSSVHSSMINLNFNSEGALALLGGGVPTFAFGQSYAKSFMLRIKMSSKSITSLFEGTLCNKPSAAKHSVIRSDTLNETSVLYVSQRNAKHLKCALEEAHLLDKNYRMAPSQIGLTVCIAVPVISQCLEMWRQFKKLGSNDYPSPFWLTLVVDVGTHSVPYSSSRLGNQTKK